MGKLRLLIFIILGLVSIFLFSTKARGASAQNVVISEVMYDLSGSDDKREWIEIYNSSDTTLKISNWKFFDGVNHNLVKPPGESDIWITPGEYVILASDRDTFLSDHPAFLGEVVDTVMSLNNTTDTISLINGTETIDSFTYYNFWGAAGNDRTLERIDPFGNTNLQSNWQESFVLTGTPGLPSSQLSLPDYPQEIFDLLNLQHAIIKTAQISSVVDGDTIKVNELGGFSTDIRLLGVDCPEVGTTLSNVATNFTKSLLGSVVDIVISQDPDEQLDVYNRTLAVIIYNGEILNIELLKHGLATYYISTNSLLKQDSWQQLALNVQSENLGIWASQGGRTVFLSELMPNPEGSDIASEWIEIYNPLDHEINLSYFWLDNYLIPFGTFIKPKSWMLFWRNQTGISLTNSGDMIKLLFPDGVLIDSTSFNNSPEGKSWSLIDGSWSWTDQPSPEGPNLGNLPTQLEQPTKTENIQSVNSEPIEVNTGQIQDYNGYLVRVTGVITETSGNTFYIDDGSGEAKVYIQESTGINKPPMHKNDVFTIVGIIDLYRSTWRILPRKQEDVSLIKAAKALGVKKSTKKEKIKSINNPLDLTNSLATAKAIEGVQNNNSPPEVQNNFWIQLLKAIIGLSIVFLGIFIFRIIRIKREKPIGYNFGDDET